MNIAVLGNAGCGKSTAAAIIGRYVTAKIVESDDLTHEAYAPGTPGWKVLADHFGNNIVAPDGTIDRAKLGEIIFSTPREQQFLRSVVDPFVRERIRQELVDDSKQSSGAQHGVLASYLMIERAWFPDAFHHALVITCSRPTCIARLQAARGWSADFAETVLKDQLSSDDLVEEARAMFGTRVSFISNDGDILTLERAVREFLFSLLSTRGTDEQTRWAEYLENESSHLLTIFIAEQQRASWLLAVSGALLATVVANKPAPPLAPLSAFTSAIGFLSLAVLFSLFSVYPVDGYRRLYFDLFGKKYRHMRAMSLEEFIKKQAKPGAWSVADYLQRVQYHYRSHWLIAFRRKRMMAWATLLAIAGVAAAAIHLLRLFL